MEPVYETRKQQIKKSKGQVYSQKHVRIQERVQAKQHGQGQGQAQAQHKQKPKQKQKKK
jgi:hypothetical protein